MMKTIALLFILGITSLQAQTLHYQGVARNAAGTPLANTSISIRLNIKDAQENGNTLYTETKSVTTNGFGLYSISINDGNGTRTGNFAAIDWSQQRFIQTETDPANGTAFTDLGTAPLHSVPQAFNALQAATLKGIPEPKEGYFIEYLNGEWRQKPKPKGAYLVGAGLNPGSGTTPTYFVGATHQFVVEEDNPIITISITKALGSTQLTGGLGLIICLGYRKAGESEIHYFEENGPNGMQNIRVASGTRVPMTLSGRFKTNFKAGDEYIVGMTAFSPVAASSWNDNGTSIGYVEISY